MSKHNKVNKSNYDQGGRLTSEELAREYKKQRAVSPQASEQERVTGKRPARGAERDDNRPRNESEE
jgi:hypothetical protein